MSIRFSMEPDVRVAWAGALRELKNLTSDSVGYKIYLEQAVPIKITGAKFTIAVPILIVKNMIEARYSDLIEAALERATGKGYILDVIIDSDPKKLQEQAIYPPTDPTTIGVNSVNPKYTFENFVIGSSNELACSAAISAAEKPGYIYNPLFLYGRSGLGKTHLLHAIGNRIKENHPDYNIMYATSETFTSEFVNSLKDETQMDFKKKYRSVDVLLIDDVQFIERTEATQEEFFHTFNALYAQNKQIALTSDRRPSDLMTLEERLRTRFSQGLTTDLSVPNYETRLAILKRKAQEHHVVIPDVVLEYIAERIKSNIRELEGCLLKIMSMSQLSDNTMTIEYAETVIKSILPEDGIIKITPDKIMDRVASFYKITKDDLTGKTRVKSFAFPRQVGMYLCNKLTDMNYKMIGNAFGGKDRSTVDHNVKKIEELLKTDESLKADINYIINDLETI